MSIKIKDLKKNKVKKKVTINGDKVKLEVENATIYISSETFAKVKNK